MWQGQEDLFFNIFNAQVDSKSSTVKTAGPFPSVTESLVKYPALKNLIH